MPGRHEKIIEALRQQEHVREEGGKLVWSTDVEVAIYVDQRAEVLAIAKVASLSAAGGLLRLTTHRGEVYVFDGEALAGFRFQVSEQRARERGAGFVG
jgi:hypothetical protein